MSSCRFGRPETLRAGGGAVPGPARLERWRKHPKLNAGGRQMEARSLNAGEGTEVGGVPCSVQAPSGQPTTVHRSRIRSPRDRIDDLHTKLQGYWGCHLTTE